MECNLHDIDQRLDLLLDADNKTKYAKQKESLKIELESFLCSLPGYVALEIVTPRDLCRFLVYKDQHGKTQVHQQSCSYHGQNGCHDCKCHLRLSYKTVDSYIGKLRAIFDSIGRDSEWD